MDNLISIPGAEEESAKRLRLLREMVVAETLAALEGSGCPCIPEYLAMVSPEDWNTVAASVHSEVEAAAANRVEPGQASQQCPISKDREIRTNDPLGAMFA